MDQLERAGANDDRLALGAHDGGGGEKPGPEGGHEFTTADPGCHQRNSSVALDKCNKHAAQADGEDGRLGVPDALDRARSLLRWDLLASATP